MQSDSQHDPGTTPVSAPSNRRNRRAVLLMTAVLCLAVAAATWYPMPFLAVPTIALGLFIGAHAIWPIR